MELWKDVVGAEEFYQVSSYGRVRNKITKDILKPSKSGEYRHIGLRYGFNKDVLIHRLVAEAFIPNPLGLRCVNHIDENKENNRADNLEWCSYQYNTKYGQGALKRNQRIIQYDLQGNAIKIWESMKEASEELGLCYQGISNCCRGIKKSCGGYAWTYANIQNIRMRWKKNTEETESITCQN